MPPDAAGAPANTSPPSRRAAILRTTFVVGVLAIVFLVILPRFIDYQEVIAAFQGLTAQQILFVSVIGVVAWFATGAIFSALIEGLSWLRGTQAWLILAGIGASIPLGPWNMAVLWVVIRGWGRGAQETTGGVALYGVFDQLSRLAMGIVGAIILIFAEGMGTVDELEGNAVVALGVISLVLFAVAAGILIGIVRSEPLARRIGAFGATVGRLRLPHVSAGRACRTSWARCSTSARPSAASFGNVGSSRSRSRWSRSSHGPSCCSPLCGSAVSRRRSCRRARSWPSSPRSSSSRSCRSHRAAQACPELLYISMFTTLTDGQYSAEISAGVMLYRAYQWFLPIPLAWILLGRSRHGKSLLPTASEFKGGSPEAASA